MAQAALQTSASPRITYTHAAVGAVAALTILRLLVLQAADFNLYGDEAQYWAWSRDLALGYFSKPPLVAWIIRASSLACGQGEACIRAASPLFHGATALVLFALAARFYGRRAAFWTALAYATLPAVSLSSILISTDVPLLFFWSAALYFLLRTFETRDFRFAAATGAAIGLGLLGKYAMAYIVPCAIVFCLMEPRARWFLASKQAALVLAVAVLFLAPNLYWNFAHGWATFAHTAANANWSGSLFHPDEALAFLGSQFGVFGPIFFAGLLWRFAMWRPGAPFASNFLIAFSAPVLAAVLIEAFLSRAHANWAAPAYCAGTVLVAGWLAERGRAFWLKASVALHLAAAIVLYGAMAAPGAVAELSTGFDPFVRLRGWDVLAEELKIRLDARPGAALLTDDRMTMAELLYYLRDRPTEIRIWNEDGQGHNQFGLSNGIDRSRANAFLFVTADRDSERVTGRFRAAKFAEILRVPVSTAVFRTFYLFDLQDPLPAGAPQTGAK